MGRGLEVVEFDLEDLLKKKSILTDKHHFDRHVAKNTNQSLLGQDGAAMVHKGNKHDVKAHRDDIRNIGAGTRCMKCGMLHFMWTPNCHACGVAMMFNMAHDGKPGRTIT